MTLDDIVNEVLRQGKREAGQIQKEFGKQVLLTLKQADSNIRKLREKAKQKAERESKLAGAKLLSSAELDASKQVLKAKAEVLDAVKADVLNRLRELPIVDRERHLKILLAKARGIIPEGTVQCNQADKDIVRMNLGSYRLGDELDMTGGIIIESADRTKRLDLSFGTLFEETWEQTFSQISDILFKGV